MTGRFLTTVPPGKPLSFILNIREVYHGKNVLVWMFCIFYEMVSQMQPQEETEKRFRKNKVYCTIDPRDRRLCMSCRAT